MAEKKTCFIIMPITTPDQMLGVYRDGEQHFKHVLECLFIPSMEKAGFEAIPPEAKGSDLIHAEIIGSLESSDLVLCDMSCLNPNVFFEFGIRTSLNRPVCVVKDEHTPKVPFDTSLLNHHEYSSTLGAWELEKEVEALAKHVTESADRSGGENTLWKYFGLRSEAKPYQGDSGSESRLDLFAMQLDSIQQSMSEIASLISPPAGKIQSKGIGYDATRAIGDILGARRISCEIHGNEDPIEVYTYERPPEETIDLIRSYISLIFNQRVVFGLRTDQGRIEGSAS